MFGSMKRRVALATTAGALCLAGSALASSPALAAQYNLTKSSGGAPVPIGTTYSATSGTISFVSSNGSTTYASCTSSTLSGATDAIVSGGPSAGLTVTGGSFPNPGCTLQNGSHITVTPSFSPAWQITPTGGTSSPFTGTISNINVKLQCSASATATYTGTLSSGGQEINSTSGSQIKLTNASSLTESASTGGGCAGVPSTVYVTGTYTLTQVGGSAVSSTNNLWLNYS